MMHNQPESGDSDQKHRQHENPTREVCNHPSEGLLTAGTNRAGDELAKSIHDTAEGLHAQVEGDEAYANEGVFMGSSTCMHITKNKNQS